MSQRLIEALEKAIESRVQHFPVNASVMVQFAAGHFQEVLEALKEAKAALEPEVEEAPVQPPAPSGDPIEPAGPGTAGETGGE